MITDPVCGMTLSEQTPFRYVYQGKTYHFCSPQCLHAFRDHPENYQEKSAPLQVESHGSGLYVCPMHPYAMQSGPGPCPKCGVAMEPIESLNPENIKFVTGTLHPD